METIKFFIRPIVEPQKSIVVKALILSTCFLVPAHSSSFKENEANLLARSYYKSANAENTLRTTSISKMISILRPKFSIKKRMDVAGKIQHALKKHKIEPRLVVAIIDTESEFNHSLISETGDISLAQINVEVWNKEFKRLKKKVIDVDRMKNDQMYSLVIMTDILSILKDRYGKKDKQWYARYHSGTKKYKQEYIAKLESRLFLLESQKKVNMGMYQ